MRIAGAPGVAVLEGAAPDRLLDHDVRQHGHGDATTTRTATSGHPDRLVRSSLNTRYSGQCHLPNSLLNLYRRRRYGYRGVMELHGMARGDVVEVIARAGGVLVDVAPEPLAGGPWHSYRYIVRAPERSSGTSR